MKPPHKKSKDVELLEDFIGNMLSEEVTDNEPKQGIKPEFSNKTHTSRSNTTHDKTSQETSTAPETSAGHENSTEAETVTPQIITLSATQPTEKEYDDPSDEHHERLLQVQNLLSRMPGVQQAPVKHDAEKSVKPDDQHIITQPKIITTEQQLTGNEPTKKTELEEPKSDRVIKQNLNNNPTPDISDADVFSDDVTREVTRAREMLGNSFQTLIFEVGKLPLAVPLAKLGGIHVYSEEDITPIFGTPDWFKGLIPAEQGNIMLVDTAQFIMPEKYPAIKDQLDYKYAILLDDTRWALACTEVREAKHLNLDDIRWSQKNSKNEWFAGMVVEFMCALLEVDSLINLLYQRGQSQKSR